MARVVVLGAGISGHTAAAFLRKKLSKKKHEIVVISPNDYYEWIPSNIWVGVGRMKQKQVRFKLNKLYKRWKIQFHQAKVVSIHPDGNSEHEKPFIKGIYTEPGKEGQEVVLEYDFLINATGPKLNFEATEGLGPGKHSHSICSSSHAVESWESLQNIFEAAEKGETKKLLIGTGHGSATCQGAAFEYTLNIAAEVKRRGIQDKLEITWITNEYELGDFGMGGAYIKQNGYVVPTKVFTESVLAEFGVNWIKRAGVYKLEPGVAHFELLDGTKDSIEFDFSMLIPSFTGAGIKAFGKDDEDITSKLFTPNGFMKVDADYTPKEYENYSGKDWPETYQNPEYENIFAIGIAFAPPHPISKPMKSPNGTVISPAPPRTGMPSGVTGKTTALNIAAKINWDRDYIGHRASMAKMGAACIISAGYGIFKGQAATMTVNPIVPDWEKYPKYGRDISYTVGEIGLAGHWMKLVLHYMFLHKAKGYPFWWLIPE